MGAGTSVTINANAKPDGPSGQLDVLVLGGQPLKERVAMYGPFVMNTKAEIGQAMEDFEAGRLGSIPPHALMPHVPDPAPLRTERTGI
jgi:redox-sensitive bicupin YhaK (pirin superfamily)